jgi:D-alanyl-D-alanine carboxypeptidase
MSSPHAIVSADQVLSGTPRQRPLRCVWLALLVVALLAGIGGCSDARKSPGAGDGAAGDAAAGDRAARNGANTDDRGAAPERDAAPTEEPVHPEFDMTRTELLELVSGLEEPIQRRVSRRPEYFLELVGQTLDLESFATVLVDKQHPLSADYVPEDLVALRRYADSLTLNKEDMQLRADVVPWLTAMSDAAALDGITLPVSSAYRSYQYQDNLFAYWTRELGREEASRVSAQPGESQHQLGTTVDFGSITPAFADTAASRWLMENAWRFGFSLSYPEGYEAETGYSYESWHYRYITVTGTRLEREFFGGIQQRMLEFLANNRDVLARARSSAP